MLAAATMKDNAFLWLEGSGPPHNNAALYMRRRIGSASDVNERFLDISQINELRPFRSKELALSGSSVPGSKSSWNFSSV